MKYQNEELSVSLIIERSLKDKKIEPIPRVKDLYHVSRGCRNLAVLPRYIHHKYPIVNGLSNIDLMGVTIAKHNALLQRLINKKVF
jgi:hypothetical protein